MLILVLLKACCTLWMGVNNMNISEERRQYHRYPVDHLSARIIASSKLAAEFPQTFSSRGF